MAAAFPFFVPENRREAVCELLIRLQGQIWFGRFEMDWDRGEVLVQLSRDLADTPFTPKVCRHMLVFLTDFANDCLPRLARVVFGGTPPWEVAAEAAAEADTGDDGEEIGADKALSDVPGSSGVH